VTIPEKHLMHIFDLFMLFIYLNKRHHQLGRERGLTSTKIFGLTSAGPTRSGINATGSGVGGIVRLD